MQLATLKRSRRPHIRSLTRGRVKSRSLAASACFSPCDLIAFWSWIRRSARMRRCSASSGGNPRSRKTFPVERVIFSFIVGSPASFPPSLQEFAQTLPCELQVAFRSPLRVLLECVEHVDSLVELCEVDDAMLESRVHANLANAETNRRHGLPVIRLKSTLNPPELKSSHLSRIGGEAAQIVSGGLEPDHGLLGPR